ncbi:transmembrane protein TMEM64 like protein [Babesia gibsoni]|uniref:Transmembrane protein TMEM64 like protein n=1 Tax=Babesia gibsoni TaxID=33632 RepID=A0AAD8PDT0_BABGI|nr:transmembrane protein TMEM64 like protein [Babesia gibsoni]
MNADDMHFDSGDDFSDDLFVEEHHNPWPTRICLLTWICMTPLAIIYRNEITSFFRVIAVKGEELGKISYLYYVLIFSLTVPLCMSVDILFITAGFIFTHIHGQYGRLLIYNVNENPVGIAVAICLSFIGYLIATLICFLMSRYLLLSYVKKYFHHYKYYGAVIRATEKEGLPMVFMIRLSPFFPPALVSYILGATNVKIHHYCLASFGALPTIAFFTYMGSLCSDLSSDTATPRTNTEIVLCFVGALTVTVVAIYYTYIVTKRHLEPSRTPMLARDVENVSA